MLCLQRSRLSTYYVLVDVSLFTEETQCLGKVNYVVCLAELVISGLFYKTEGHLGWI